jgi:predicted nuclease with TOPRIM domain
MTDRTELQRERDELAQINDNRRAEIEERAARIAAIDAELAKLPEGWTTTKRCVKVATSRLLAIIDGMVEQAAQHQDFAAVAEWNIVRATVEAAPHSVDLRTLWEEPGEKHTKTSGDAWLAKVVSDDGEIDIETVYYKHEWIIANAHVSLESRGYRILALANPAKLIGGGE